MHHLEAVELHRVLLGETHDGGVRDVHPHEFPRADVFRELLDVLGGDGRCYLELQDDRVVDFQVQTPHVYGNRARHTEDVDLSQTRDALMVEIDLEHALVEGLGRSGFVLLDDVGAGLLDDAHECWTRLMEQAGLKGLGPGHCKQNRCGFHRHVSGVWSIYDSITLTVTFNDGSTILRWTTGLSPLSLN